MGEIHKAMQHRPISRTILFRQTIATMSQAEKLYETPGDQIYKILCLQLLYATRSFINFSFEVNQSGADVQVWFAHSLNIVSNP